MTIFDDDDDEQHEQVEQLLSDGATDLNIPWQRSHNQEDDDAKVAETVLSGHEPDDLRSRLLSETAGTIGTERAVDRLDDQRVKNAAKGALAELYGSDFEPTNPPQSIDRYEKTQTLRSLEAAVVNMAARPSARNEYESDEPHIEQAVLVIEQMKAYGEVAEPYLAHVARGNKPVMPVRKAAVEALGEIRDEQEPNHSSLREALAAWLRPGGDG